MKSCYSRLYGGLLLLLLVLLLSSSASASLSQAVSPEARERAIVREMNQLLVPGPAGWEMIRDVPRYQGLEHQLIGVRYILYNPYGAITYTFGPHASAAWSVALCEGGRPVPSIHAQNGQFLGMFQMGDFARSTYGHGSYALAQARAAYRYFVASGSDWSPWQCKP